jgi:hypothetical protein
MHQYKGHPHLIHLTGKSKLIHVYRDLCAEGSMTRRQAIENQLIKKLGKSAYGGVNLSIFIPPGHSAPMWSVTVSRVGDHLHVDVTERKSVYTLVGYTGYVQQKRTPRVDGNWEAVEISDERMTLRQCSSAKAEHTLFNLSVNEFVDVASVPEGGHATGMLKGTQPLLTCTFGCVYCPTELNEVRRPAYSLTHL